jgi:hypothetical protein
LQLAEKYVKAVATTEIITKTISTADSTYEAAADTYD